MLEKNGNDKVRVHLYVSGLVQGVFFRAHTTKVARSLHVMGWVRNLNDGRVEIVAEGPRSRVNEFISWCEKGPSTAEVESVEIDWEWPGSDLDGFRTLY
jgi:acylphosphatase